LREFVFNFTPALGRKGSHSFLHEFITSSYFDSAACHSKLSDSVIAGTCRVEADALFISPSRTEGSTIGVCTAWGGVCTAGDGVCTAGGSFVHERWIFLTTATQSRANAASAIITIA